jgi:hypothetical protein
MTTTCPRCNYPGKDQRAQAAGRIGGRARGRKGLAVASADVRARVAAAGVAARQKKAQFAIAHDGETC